MTVYVDELFTMTPRTQEAKRYGKKWCHLWADTRQELHDFADELFAPVPVKTIRRWFQKHPTLPHYDLTESKREKAIRMGAQVMTTQDRLRQARERLAAQTATDAHDDG